MDKNLEMTIVDMRKQNIPVRVISQQLHINAKAIYRVLGPAKRETGCTPHQKQQITMMRARGYLVREIAAKLGLNEGQVHHVLNPEDHRVTDRKAMPCICPKCGKKYKRQLYWTGSTVPRLFCTDCEYLRYEHTDSQPSMDVY